MDKVHIRIGSQSNYYENYSEVANEIDSENRLPVMSKLSYNCYPVNDPFELTGWSKIQDFNDIKIPTKGVIDKGLHFETWISDTNQEVTVAFVFRGTKKWIDWKSNLRFIRKLYSTKVDYYEQVSYLIPKLIVKIENKYKHKEIIWVSTGHSLGGGLAQLTLYLNEKIKIAYVFNSSPVTGYWDEKNRNKFKVGKQVYTVYLRGEILYYGRMLLDLFNPFRLVKLNDPKVIRIRFYKSKIGHAFKKHSMLVLANILNKY